ncbi:hypothetical protein HDU88_008418 [Geranomyces variabilis]|nr:hypothetical protein HDU88_008418 [Geranomyces variabilis]
MPSTRTIENGFRIMKNKNLGVKWYGNIKDPITGKATGAQNHVLALLQPGQFPAKAIMERSGWWGALTPHQLAVYIRRNVNIFEVIPEQGRRKIYFDVDLRLQSVPLDTIRDAIATAFPNAALQVSGRLKNAKGEDDMSFHITLSNYYAEDLVSMRDPIRRFCVKHKHLGFDTAVYSKNQAYKCINQSKPDKEVQEYISGSTTLTKHLIMHDFDDDAVNFVTLPYFVQDALDDASAAETAAQSSSIRNTPSLDILALPQLNLDTPVDFDWLSAEPLDKLAMLPNPKKAPGTAYIEHGLMWIILVWSKNVGISFEAFWAWCKKKNDTVPRFAKYVKQWDAVKPDIFVKRDTLDVLLERHYPRIRQSQSTRRLREQMKIADIITVPGFAGRYLSVNDIDPRKKYTALISPMGAGKTEAVIGFVKAQSPHLSTLWVTPRVTLSVDTRQRLADNGLKFLNYSDVTKRGKLNGELSAAKLLICSIQSLHYLTENVDTIICDEIETILMTFAGNADTHKVGGVTRNWNIWLTLVHNARKVVLMDAMTSRTTTNMIEALAKRDRLRKPHTEIITTPASPPPREFLEFATFDGWLFNILDLLRKGQKLYVFTPFRAGKRGVETISAVIRSAMKWTEGEELLCYYADKIQEKKRLQEVELIWGAEEVRVVVTNGTISVGVNYNPQNVFHSIHAYYTPQISPRDFFQSLYRVRHPIDSCMCLFRDTQCRLGYMKNEPQVEHPSNLLTDESAVTISNTESLSTVCPIFRQLRKDLAIEELASKNYKGPTRFETFDFFAELANVSTLPQDRVKVASENEKYVSDMLRRAEVCFDWDRIEDIIPGDETNDCVTALESFIYSNKATMQSRLIYQKYCFRSSFPPDTPVEALKRIWKNGLDMPSKVYTLQRNPNHIINTLLQENGAHLGEDFPPAMTTAIPLEEIKAAFSFHNPPKDYRTHLVSRMLETFFGRKVYEACYERKQVKGKREWVYKTDERFKKLVAECLQYLSA